MSNNKIIALCSVLVVTTVSLYVYLGDIYNTDDDKKI